MKDMNSPDTVPEPDPKTLLEMGAKIVEHAQDSSPDIDPAGTEADWDANLGFTPPPSPQQKLESIRYGKTQPPQSPDDYL